MATDSQLATRILVVYESSLPMDGKANLAARVEAMRKAVEGLSLREVGSADLKDVLGATIHAGV